MNEIALADLNSFAPVAQQAEASPEESVFVLSSSRLQEILARALQPLQDRIESLEAIIANLEAKVSGMESSEEQDVTRLTLDIALDRQRLSKLEQKEPQPLQKDRGEILRALLAANNGKMLSTDVRKKMHMDRASFSRLLSTMDDIEAKPYHLHKNWKVLVLK